MVLTLQKKVVISMCAGALLVSVLSTHPKHNDTAAQIATGFGITALVGLVGAVGAGIYYLCNKSDEQVFENAREAYYKAHQCGLNVYSTYMNVFKRYHGEPTLQEIELNFLLPVIGHCIPRSFVATESTRPFVITHIDEVVGHVQSLRNALSSVSDRIQKIERDGKHYNNIYNELCSIRSDIQTELAYLEEYSKQLTRHRAFFELYEYESKLCGIYVRELEIGRNYQHDPYLFELYIMQSIGTHNLRSNYPVIAYHTRLTDHIHQLEIYVRQLRYHYPSRMPLAQQLLGYLRYVRGVIEVTAVFKEEKRMKKEADDRAEWLAIQERQAAALEANAYAARLRADAERESARAERERNRIEREKYGIASEAHNPTVSVTFRV